MDGSTISTSSPSGPFARTNFILHFFDGNGIPGSRIQVIPSWGLKGGVGKRYPGRYFAILVGAGGGNETLGGSCHFYLDFSQPFGELDVPYILLYVFGFFVRISVL